MKFYSLTRALFKPKRLKPKRLGQRRPKPLLSLAVLGVLSVPWLILMSKGVRSRQQQAEMAVLSETFFAQVQPRDRNAAAQQFDRLSADLGFVPNDPRGLTYKIDPSAEKAFYAIEPALNDFLSLQVAKVSGPLDPIPSELSSYLTQAAPKVEAIQTHLLTQATPQWEIDIAQMTEVNYPFPGLVNTANTQKLLLLSALAAHQRQQPDEMLNALEASWWLNRAIAQRPDLVSQVSASATFEYQAGLLRHLDAIPEQWQPRLAQQAIQLSVIDGLTFDIWLQYGSLQKAFARIVAPNANRTSNTAQARLSGTLSYWFSPIHYFNLTNIDTAKTAHRALKRLDRLTVCSTTPAAAEQVLSQEKTADWNEAIAPTPAVLARRWKVAGDRALASELTHHVLQIKQHTKTAGQWPATLPDRISNTCPKEQWIYKKDETAVSITLSAPLSLEPAVPLSWQLAL